MNALNTQRDWKDFRAAAMRKDDEAALAAISSILVKNPHDPNALKEKGRLLKKEGRRLLAEIEEAVDAEDRFTAASLVQEIESIPGMQSLCASSAAWQSACRIRYQINFEQKSVECRRELERLRQLVTGGRLVEAAASIQSVLQLDQQFAGLLNDEDRKFLEEADKSVKRGQARAKEERVFKEAVNECAKTLASFEGSRLNLRSLSGGELEKLQAELQQGWSRVSRSKGNAPGGMGQKVEDAVNQLVGEDLRRKRKRRVKKMAIAAVFVGLIGGASFYLFITWEKGNLMKAIDSQIASRDFVALERTLNKAQRYKSTPEVAKKISAGQTWVGMRKSEAESIENDLSTWEEHAEQGYANTENIASADAAIKEVYRRAGATPDHFRERLKGRAFKILSSWDQHVKTLAVSASEERARLVSEAEGLLEVTEVDKGVDEEVVQTFEALDKAMVAELEALEPEAGLALKYQRLSEKYRKVTGLANEVANIKRSLLNATSLQQYLAALQGFEGRQFLGLEGQGFARQVLLAAPDQNRVLQEILLPGDSIGWAGLFDAEGNLVSRLSPEDALPGELRKVDLLEDKFISEVYRVEARLEAEGKAESLYVVGGLPEDASKRRYVIVRYYNEEEDDISLGPIYPISSAELVAESKFLQNKLNLAASLLKFSKRGFKPDVSIQEYVDLVVGEESLSPMFKAFLFQRLVSVTDLRPEQWQCSLTPDLVSDNGTLKKQVGVLASRDWFSATKAQKYEAAVGDFFESLQTREYGKQLRLNRRLIELAKQAGCHYAGYMSDSGEPQLVDWASESHQIFGLNADTGSVEELTIPGVNSNLPPYSPLFAIRGDAGKMLADAASFVGLSEDAARELALPFFQ